MVKHGCIRPAGPGRLGYLKKILGKVLDWFGLLHTLIPLQILQK